MIENQIAEMEDAFLFSNGEREFPKNG